VKKVVLILCFLAAVPGAVRHASADVISIGFEPGEGYAPGSIAGQTGGPNSWFVANSNYDQQVTGAAAHSGTQSFLWSNQVSDGIVQSIVAPQLSQAAGETGSTANGGATAVTPGFSHFVQDFWFRTASQGADPGLSVNVSADDGSGRRMTFFRLADVNGSFNAYYLPYDKTVQGFPVLPVELNLLQGTWYHAMIDIDFVDGPSNDIVTVSLGTTQNLGAGDVKLTSTTWEDYNPDNQPQPTPIAVNTTLFRLSASGDGNPVQGVYLDDLSYGSGAPDPQAPEPASALLFTIGLAGLGSYSWRRRQRNAGNPRATKLT
jgi:hypothetical protein